MGRFGGRGGGGRGGSGGRRGGRGQARGAHKNNGPTLPRGMEDEIADATEGGREFGFDGSYTGGRGDGGTGKGGA